ncbi:hypothetical protein [Aureimonas sp. Leaf454]|nr:hypothetical protein [Aureimonas sp. Leaf454]
MMILAMSLAMVAGLVTATAVTLHSEAEASRVKVLAKKNRMMH